MDLKKSDIITLIKKALAEDCTYNDITSLAIIDKDNLSNFNILAKEEFILCGIEIAKEVFLQQDPTIHIDFQQKDGCLIGKGEEVLRGYGSTQNILSAERVALNFLQYISGIATKTQRFVKIIKNSKIKILDTRKTLPLYRNIAKYAVQTGGGENHRFTLNDMVLIKDNHIKSSRNILSAVNKVENYLRENNLQNIKIEIECETIKEVEDALQTKADIIMLDNMNYNNIEKACNIINKQKKIEVSGNITLKNLINLVDLEIDYISVGSLTHSINSIDLSLNISTNCNKKFT